MATAPKKAGCLEVLLGLVFFAALLAFPVFLIILIVNLFAAAASSHHASFDDNASSIALIGAPGKTVAFNLTGKTLDATGNLGTSQPLWASDTGVSLELSNPAGFDQIFSLVGIVPNNWGDSIWCSGDCMAEDFTINLKFTLPSPLAKSPGRILTGHITGDIITPQPTGDGFENNQKQLDIPVSLQLRTASVSGYRQAIETSLTGTLISFGVAVAGFIAVLKIETKRSARKARVKKTRRPARKVRIKKERQPRMKATASAQAPASNPPAPGSGRPLPEPGALLSCSFCGNHQKLVRKLIAGPGVYICDGCAGRVRSVIAGQGDGLATTPIATIQQVGAEATETRCSFCGKRRHQVTAMASTGDTRIICVECLELCEEILREELLSTASEATAPLASAPQPTHGTSPAGFQTFTNSDNSFTITYPGDWQQQAASPGSGSQFTSQDQQKVFCIAAGDPGTSHADPATAVSTACSNAGGTPSQPQTVSINGQPWAKVEYDLPDKSTHMVVLASDYKGRLFVIAYGSPKASFDSDASQFFDPMEQSFQFLA